MGLLKRLLSWVMFSFCGSYLAAHCFDPKIVNVASDLEKYIAPSLNKRAKKHACHLQNPVYEVGLEELRVFVYVDTEEGLEAKAYDIRKAVMKGVAESKYLLRYTNHGMTSPCFVGVTFYNPKLEVLGGFWNGNYYPKPPGDRWTGRWEKKFTPQQLQKLKTLGCEVNSDSVFYFTQIETDVEAVGVILFISPEDPSLNDRDLNWFCNLYRKILPVMQEMFPGKFLMLEAGSSGEDLKWSFFVNVRNNVVHTVRSKRPNSNQPDFDSTIHVHQLDDVVPTSLHREIKLDK